MQELYRQPRLPPDAAYRIIEAVTPIFLRVKELREAKGLTQLELASRAKVRQATLSAIENGQTSAVDFYVLERLAKALDVDPGFLVASSGQKSK